MNHPGEPPQRPPHAQTYLGSEALCRATVLQKLADAEQSTTRTTAQLSQDRSAIYQHLRREPLQPELDQRSESSG